MGSLELHLHNDAQCFPRSYYQRGEAAMIFAIAQQYGCATAALLRTNQFCASGPLVMWLRCKWLVPGYMDLGTALAISTLLSSDYVAWLA